MWLQRRTSLCKTVSIINQKVESTTLVKCRKAEKN